MGLVAVTAFSIILAVTQKSHITTLVCGWCMALTFIVWNLP
jgi:hypothetical protein